MAATTQLLITFICTLFSLSMARWPAPGQVCPCTCTLSQDPQLTSSLGPGQYKQVDCRGLSLREVPQDFPRDTEVVLLSNNNIGNLVTDNLDEIKGLLYLDLSYNNIRYVPREPFTYTTRLKFLNLGWNRIQNVVANAFQKLQSLNRLLLPSNSLRSIPGAINNLSAVYHVDLSKNQITTVARTAFQRMPQMQYLNLESNSISAIDANIIRQLPLLQSLLLTQNQISYLPTYIFHGMQNLDHVALGNNNIINLPGTIFRGAPRLRVIDLHQNRLAYLDPQLFRGMRFLEEVNLSKNRLQQLPPGIFQGLRTLAVVNLRGNDRLRTLPVGIFRGLLTLEEVHLSHLELIPEGLLWGLGALESLTITDSNVKTALPSILRDLSRLQELNLANNGIDVIPESLFEELRYLELLDLSSNQLTQFSMMWFNGNTMQNLGTLNLQNNKIQELPPEAFVQMPSLQALNLEGNQLVHIKENIFGSTIQLESLLLSNNRIRTVSPGIIPKLLNVEKLTITNNKLTCDCHLKPFAEWLKMHVGAVASPNEIVCAVPKLYQNRQVIQLVQSPQNPFTCIFPRIITRPRRRTMTLNSGDTTQLYCHLSDSAVADIIWRLPDGSEMYAPFEEPTSPLAIRPRIYARASGSLVLQNFARTDTGIYTCQTVNSVGSDEISYDMRIVLPPYNPNYPSRPRPPTTGRPLTQKPSIRPGWRTPTAVPPNAPRVTTRQPVTARLYPGRPIRPTSRTGILPGMPVTISPGIGGRPGVYPGRPIRPTSRTGILPGRPITISPGVGGRPGVYPRPPLRPTSRTGILPGRPVTISPGVAGRPGVTALIGGTANRTTLMPLTLTQTTLPLSPCNPNPCRHGGICNVVLKQTSTNSMEDDSQESYSSSMPRRGSYGERIYNAATPTGTEE